MSSSVTGSLNLIFDADDTLWDSNIHFLEAFDSFAAAVENADSSTDMPGTIVSVAPHPIVQCGVGRLRLIEVQAPGRKRIPAADFFRGKRIATGARLGS